MGRLQCSICLPDIDAYFDLSTKILGLNYELRERIVKSPVGAKSLAPGRIIIINNSVRSPEISYYSQVLSKRSCNDPTIIKFWKVW